MRFVIQNVTEASVSIDGRVNGSIGRGFAVLIGIAQTDTERIADKMMDKMFKLRVFEDEQRPGRRTRGWQSGLAQVRCRHHTCSSVRSRLREHGVKGI